MRSRMIKGISVLLAAAVTVALAACGDSGNKEEQPEFVYVPEYIELPREENQSINVLQMNEEKLYYQTWSWDEKTGESSSAYYALDLTAEDGVSQKLPVEVTGEGMDFMQVRFDAQGNMYGTVRTYENNDYENAKTLLVKYLADGTEVFQVDLSSVMSKVQDEYMRYIQYMELDQAGNIYLSNAESAVWVFDGTGNHLFTLELSTWIGGMGCSGAGDVYVTMHDGNCMVLKKIDVAAKELGQALGGLPTNFYGDVVPGSEGDFLLKSDTILYEYDGETQTYEEVLKFIECDINGSYIQKLCAAGDGKILVYYSDWNLGTEEIVRLVKKPFGEVEQREILTLGGMYVSQDIQSAIIKFNKSNDQYRITIRDYSESMGTEETAYEDAMTRMNNDILTGNAPDLITLDNVNVKMLAARGVLEDLSPYLDSSEQIRREDLVASALQAYTMNDRLCGIPISFYISTLISGKSVVGDRTDWTISEMIEAADRLPQDAPVMEYATKDYMLQILVLYGVDSYLDWESGKCSFESEEFIKVLEFANRFPAQREYSEDDPVMPELVEQGKLLAVNQTISSAGDYQIIRTIWGEDVTCIGYPSATGNGSVLQGNEAVAISSKSRHKEAAWSFLESMLADAAENPGYSWGFPVFISGLEAKFEEDMTPNYQIDYETGEPLLDENGNPMEYSKGGWSFGNNVSYDIYAATREEVDAVKDLIYNTTTLVSVDMEMLNIIQEEAAFYFDGAKSAAEAAEVIQGRIQLYVDENR